MKKYIFSIIKNTTNEWECFFKDEYNRKKATSVFFWLLSIYFLFFGVVIFSGYQFLDDRMRSYFNYYYWNVEGRYFLYFFYKIFSLDGILRSIWPLGQIVSVMIMPFIGLLMLKKFNKAEAIILPLSIFCNPLFLENISYNFDAIGMALAAITAISSVFFIIWAELLVNYAIAFILLTFSLFCYQVSMNIFACTFFPLLVFVAVKYSLVLAIRKMIICLCVLFLSIFIYKIVITLSCFLGSNQREFIYNAYSFFHVIKSTEEFFNNIVAWCGKKYLLAFFILWSLVVFAPIFYKRNFLTFLLSLIFSISSLVGIIGPMMILSDIPAWPRVYMGFGAVIFSCSLVIVLLYGKFIKYLTVSVLIAMFIYSLIISMIYGNLLIAQKKYENFHLQRIVNEVNLEYKVNGASELRINKKLPRDILVEKAAKDIPLIDRLISSPVDNKWLWIDNSLYEFGLYENIVISIKEDTNCISDKEVFTCNGAIYYK